MVPTTLKRAAICAAALSATIGVLLTSASQGVGSVAWAQSAGATPDSGALRAALPQELGVDRSIYVVGADRTIQVQGRLPSCAGKDVTVQLYTRGPLARPNPAEERIARARVTVGADGAYVVTLALPDASFGVATLYPGVEGSCVADRRVSGSGPVLIAVRDEVENKDFAGTIVIPASVVQSTANLAAPARTLGESIGSLKVFADGTFCTEVKLGDGSATDRSGNVRIHIGGKDQSTSCSKEGAVLSFVNARGQTFFEKRTLLRGVTQPLANVAPEPPSTVGETVMTTPLAPRSGTAAETRASNPNDWKWIWLAVALGSTGLAVCVVALSRSRH